MSGEGADLVAELREEVARLVPDGVAVRPTPDGFVVGYLEPLVRHRHDGDSVTSLRAEVTCDPATLVLTITDVVAGEALHVDDGVHAGLSLFRGRVSGNRRVREYGRRPDGTWGLLRDQVHSARALHRAIREPAAALGWQEKQPVSATIGKVVGIGAAVAVALAAVVVGVLALAGRLG